MSSSASKKIPAGICGILLGALGIHKFILGYTKEGVIMLVVSIVGSLLFGLGPLVMGIIGLIEGIMYLVKSDDEFVSTYVNGKKGWF
jgi:TM2 domain-containing membrane protein YozV